VRIPLTTPIPPSAVPLALIPLCRADSPRWQPWLDASFRRRARLREILRAHVVLRYGNRIGQVDHEVPPAARHKDELAGLADCLERTRPTRIDR
jgi:hypothetical protein